MSGGVGACGDSDLPGIYARVEDPDVLSFIRGVSSEGGSASFWTEWGEWSECSEKCDEGTRTRTRGCVSTGGGDCPVWGERNETEACTVRPCRECISMRKN